MDPADRAFLKAFFNQLQDEALEPGDERYVPLYEREDLELEDPVELLARGIEWTPTSTVQLLSGFRGSGKSTELRRLRAGGKPSQPGRDLLVELVQRRGDWQRLLGERDRLHQLIDLSGGHFRDLFRFVSEILRRADELPDVHPLIRAENRKAQDAPDAGAR